jgi:hemerythrin
VAIEWTDDLSIGVPRIDLQHKELFDRVNALLDAMKMGKGKTEVEQTLTFLGDYVVSHFGAEEELMREHNYPAQATHKAQHTRFVADFASLTRTALSGSTNPTLTIGIQRSLVDWLTNHISKTDKALGAFLTSAKQEKRRAA